MSATVPAGDLADVAARILEKRGAILDVAARHATPFYLFDGAALREALAAFAGAFDARIAGHRAFYAVKSNHHPRVVETAVHAGFGLDVSSGRELEQALAFDACPILFSGPGKSDADLSLAVAHAERVTVNLDSFRELERLGRAANGHGRTVRAGVRVSTEHHGAWSKFGVPLRDLARFWRAAQAYPGVALQGIQFHLSWNRSPAPYVRILEDLARCLGEELTEAERAGIAFVDVGGGFRPHRLEGEYREGEGSGPVVVKESVPIEAYAEAIGGAIDRCLRPLLEAAYYTEPGRIVSTPAMHIVLGVVDRKSDDLVIVDGGINMVGWEKYLHVHCPVVNLSRPALREIPVRLGGSLCDCEDVWGLSCYGEAIEEGDVLVVPFQGAYTFCVAQQFIRAIPEVVELE
jgi:diaminopimelate decarboxylase